MNRFVETAEMLNWLLNASLQAALLVPVILLVQWLLRRRLSARWRFALWWLLIVRLLLPVSFASPWSVFNYVQPQVNLAGLQFSPPAAAEAATLAPNVVGEAALVRLANNDSARIAVSLPTGVPQAVQPVEPSPATPLVAIEPTEVVGPAPSPRSLDAGDQLIPLIWATWFLIALALIVAVAVQSVSFSRRLRSARQNIPAPLDDLLAECRRIMGIRREVTLLETEAVTSPVLYGLFRHRILLPWGFADRFSPAELRHVLLHELAHVKRGDLWLNWLVTALQIVHWFNPLVWLGFARLRADRELACDELALLRSGADTGRDYGRTMLKLLEDFARPKAMPGLVGILEDKQQMQRRVRMIARFKRPSRWSALALIPIAALGLVLLTDAQVPKPEPAEATVQENDNASDDDAGLATQDQSPLFGTDELATSFFGPIEEQSKAWTGRLLEGLRLACLPDRSRYALGDEITLRCTITNTSDREHRINWHPTAGDRFKLRGEPPVLQMQSAAPRAHWMRERGGELPYFAPVDVRSPVRIEKKPGTPSSEIILPARTSVELIHRRPARQTGTFHWVLAYEAFMPAIGTQETMELLDQLTLLSEPFEYEVTESGDDEVSVNPSPATSTPDNQNFIVLEGGGPSHGLDLYRELTGLELVISPHVTNVLSLLSLGPLAGDKEKLTEEIVKALREQCGLIITRIDERRASVTYNEALVVKPVPAPEGRRPTSLGPDGSSTAKPPPSPPRPPSNDPGSVESSAPTSSVRKPIFELRLVESAASDDTETLSVRTPAGDESSANLQNLFVRKEPLLDATALASANVGTNEFTGRPVINLEFTAEGQARFAEVTRAHVARQIAFVVDGQVISAPHINEPITGGKAQISGSFTHEEAERLAHLIDDHIRWKPAVIVPAASSSQAPARFLEIITEIEFENWDKFHPQSDPLAHIERHRTRSVIGTNSWMIESDYNGHFTRWFTGTRIIARGDAITGYETGDASPAGRAGVDGLMGFDLPAAVTWQAFGSGPAHRQGGAKLYPPGPLWEQARLSPAAWSESTDLFNDNLGLPKAINIFTTDGHLIYQYEVFNSTNVLGWSVPTGFRGMAYRQRPGRKPAMHLLFAARVTAISPVNELGIPEQGGQPNAPVASTQPSSATNLFNFGLVTPAQALDVYRELTGRELIVSTQVTNVAAFVGAKSAQGSREEVAKEIKALLLEQAGLVITELDGNRASVTHNEALSVKPLADPTGRQPVPLGPNGKDVIKPDSRPRPPPPRQSVGTTTSASTAANAPFVEIEMEIEIEDRGGSSGGDEIDVSRRSFVRRCIVGTNSWMIESVFKDQTLTYWFTGTNIVTHYELNPEAAARRPNLVRFATRRFDSSDGNLGRPRGVADPIMGDLAAKLVWQAFCSGPVLRGQGKQLFPPSDLWKQTIGDTWTARTEAFSDGLGLPKSIDLVLSDGQPIYEFRVSRTTELNGWTLPEEFQGVSYRQHITRGREVDYRFTGRITSISPASKPVAPTPDVQPSGTSDRSGPAAHAPAEPDYPYTLETSPRAFTRVSRETDDERLKIEFLRWTENPRHTTPNAVFRVGNPGSREVLIWNVRQQVLATNATGGLEWKNLKSDYPGGGWEKATIPAGGYTVFPMSPVPDGDWRVCLLYSRLKPELVAEKDAFRGDLESIGPVIKGTEVE